MIKALRKRHLQIWTAWAVLLPVGIITAYTCIQRPALSQLLQPAEVAALPVQFKKIEKENYTVALRTNNDRTQFQLEWINKKTLTVPTATIYESTSENDVAKGKLIGRIEARGTYYFTVDSSLLKQESKLLVYDFIHQQIIDTIKL